MAAKQEPLVNRFGLVDEKVRELIATNNRQASVKQAETLHQNPRDRAAAVGGVGAGLALSKLAAKLGFKESKEDELAEKVQAAMGRAQTATNAIPKDKQRQGPYGQAIDEREVLINELDIAGLTEQSAKVRKQVMGLVEQEQKFAKARGDIAMDDEKLKQLIGETEALEKVAYAEDEVARLVNHIQRLDLEDPDQAAMSDWLTKRVAKLTTITGTTENDPGAYNKITIQKMDQHLAETVRTLGGFEMAMTQFQPEFLELRTKVTNWSFSALEIAGMDLDLETKKSLRAYTKFRQITSANTNAYIKLLTGAQMSEHEAKRLANDVPTLEDGPEVYRTKLKQQLKILRAIRLQDLAALSVSDDADAFRLVVSQPLSDFFEEAEQGAKEDNERNVRSALMQSILGESSGG